MKITTFVLKAASRCNLDCTYCYVYNRGDTQWRKQPKFMSPAVARRAGQVIGDYCRQNGLSHVNVQLHGGEPLMMGPAKLEELIGAVRAGIGAVPTRISSALQTNGLLLTEDILAMLKRREVGLYVSCDGPASASDAARIDHKARPVSDRLHDRLQMLAASAHRDVFEGFLCVINTQASPVEVFSYLAGFHPKAIDFLLPLENHDNPAFEASARDLYASWLMRSFNAWVTSPIKVRSRVFERIVNAQVGQSMEGKDEVGALVIECDGSFEADDTLKTAFDGAAVLGCDLFSHSVEDVLQSAAFRTLVKAHVPCETCQGCAYLAACGAGHLSHRYAAQTGFDNPSVYCLQNQKLIDHVSATVAQFMRRQEEAALA